MSNTELNIINMADVEAVAVKWLWKPYIPLGKITIIQGDPGEGNNALHYPNPPPLGEPRTCDSLLSQALRGYQWQSRW